MEWKFMVAPAVLWSNEMFVFNFGLRSAQTRSRVSYEEATVLSSWSRSAS